MIRCTVIYTNSDDGIWLECPECKKPVVNVGFDPTVATVAQAERDHLGEVHAPPPPRPRSGRICARANCGRRDVTTVELFEDRLRTELCGPHIALASLQGDLKSYPEDLNLSRLVREYVGCPDPTDSRDHRWCPVCYGPMSPLRKVPS